MFAIVFVCGYHRKHYKHPKRRIPFPSAYCITAHKEKLENKQAAMNKNEAQIKNKHCHILE